MSGPAPLSLDEARHLFAPITLSQGIERVLIACSGGPDSTALAGLYALLAAEGNHARPTIATVDHGLRPESAQEAEAVARFAARLGVPQVTLTWRGDKPRAGLQEAARAARYRLLARAARQTGAQAVVTAHTLDDQAETVLMRLLHGSGVQGLAGMADRSPLEGLLLLRPLLAVPKARLVATCEARGWPFARDPSNDSAAFLRPRLRRLLPALAREGLSAVRLARLAARARRVNDALDAQTEALRRQAALGGTGFDAIPLAQAPEEVLVRFFGAVLAQAREADPRLPAPRLERIERLAERFRQAASQGAASAWTLGGQKFALAAGRLTVAPAPPRRARSLRQTGAIASAKLGNVAVRP